jgi:hypothetical protein
MSKLRLLTGKEIAWKRFMTGIKKVLIDFELVF